MTFSATAKKPFSAASRVGSLPARLKVLYITTLHRTGGWLAEAFATDNATEIRLEESVGATAGLARLRDEIFDAVLISHEPGVLDALELIEGLRAGGADEPMIVLGTVPPQAMEAECYEVGADAYCFVEQSTTRSLLWNFSRAMERCMLVRENRRLAQADHLRLEQEHREAERLLNQQRALVAELESLQENREPDVESTAADAGISLDRCGKASKNLPLTSSLPEALVDYYREMLRTYVIMGQGNLTQEMQRLAELLAGANVTARETIHLHVSVLEELIQGLGNRSARHVLNRADLLVLEVLVHLADRYHGFLLEQIHPPQQMLLPGFDEGLLLASQQGNEAEASDTAA